MLSWDENTVLYPYLRRKVRLNPSSSCTGRHYRVIVNNVSMFMKGSNWIPAHVLPEMVTAEYTRVLLTAAAQTHQNCIRVWGGGIYETDAFYQVMTALTYCAHVCL